MLSLTFFNWKMQQIKTDWFFCTYHYVFDMYFSLCAECWPKIKSDKLNIHRNNKFICSPDQNLQLHRSLFRQPYLHSTDFPTQSGQKLTCADSAWAL